MIDLTLLHPELVAKIGHVLEKMKQNGTPMKPCSGKRTTGEQVLLYSQGRFGDKRRIVTDADGIHVKSNHQSGRAVDCCFTGDEPFGESHPWGLYGDYVRAEGLRWGGDFLDEHRRPKPDRPHAELAPDDPKVLRA